MAPITIAVAGATGYLGPHVVRAALSSIFYPHAVRRVIAFTRNARSEGAQKVRELGAEILEVKGVSVDALKGVDVLVNATPEETPAEEKMGWAKAAVDAGLKVYFPTDFGFDHYNIDIDHAVWVNKKTYEAYAREVGAGKIKVIVVQNTLFMDAWESSYAVPMGFDKKAHTWTVPVSADLPITYTHPRDIGYTVIRLAILGVEKPDTVPDRVLVRGDDKTVHEFADLITKETGKELNVVVVDGPEFKANLHDDNFGPYLTWLVGNGHTFIGKDHNELVNPGESLWKWIRVEEYMRDGAHHLVE